MKARFLFMFFLLAFLSSQAQQITYQEAINAAVNTMRYDGRSINAQMVDSVFTLTEGGYNLLYEVHFITGESVLLSGSKACIPILGFISLENGKPSNGILNQIDQKPKGLQSLISSYAQQISYCFANNVDALYANEWLDLQTYNQSRSGYSVIVDPLLTTEWGENESNDYLDPHAYNAFVTYGDGFSCPDYYYCPAGLITVAMGQIMKYWNYPNEVPDNCFVFDWDIMPDELIKTNNTSYSDQKTAIARLLKDIGTDLEIAYCYRNECYSAANEQDAVNTFVKFGYMNASLRLKTYYSQSEWDMLLQDELNNHRPILYAASNGADSYPSVCCGYKIGFWGPPYYYFNWGKIGKENGWYRIAKLTPDFSTTPLDYNHLAITEIYPSYCNDDILFTCNKVFDYQEAADYHVSNSIKNNNHIFEVNYGAEVEMSAKSIVLSNGFHAHNGATFRAMINPCTPVELRSGALDSSIIDSFDIFYNKELDNNIVSNGIILYPNPSSGELNLFLESNLGEISSVTIINAIGMVVLQKNEIGNKSINVSCLPNGIYFVKVLTSKGECLFSKFIKQ